MKIALRAVAGRPDAAAVPGRWAAVAEMAAVPPRLAGADAGVAPAAAESGPRRSPRTGQAIARRIFPARPFDVLVTLLVVLEILVTGLPRVPVGVSTLLVAGSLSLLWRRRAPIAVLGVTTAACAVGVGLGYFAPALPFGPLVAVYSSAVVLEPGLSAAATAVAGATLMGAAFVGLANDDPLFDWPVLLMVAWVLGYGVRVNRARAALLQHQAEQISADQAVATRLAIKQEQERIARELHDIVAHNVSVMVAQAAAVSRVAHVGVDQTRQALTSIETVGRAALLEMRRLLDVTHVDDDPADRWPAPSLDQIPTLVEQVERAGLPVQLSIVGVPRPLPAGIELNAYRIVQEALTNTLKHAGETTARVDLSYRADRLELHVADRGRGAPPVPNPGRGLVGMRERVALVGGTLHMGPGDDGGFEVSAILPAHDTP